MNNKIYFIIILSMVLFSCSKEDVFLYDQNKEGIQFDAVSGRYSMDIDFSFQMTQKPDEWGYPTNYYFGDSIRFTTVKLPLSIMGWKADQDRKFKLKALVGDEYSSDLVELEDSYVFRADRLKDTIELTVRRPDERGRFKVALSFDTEGAGTDFDFGAEEKTVFTFNLTDRYTKPSDWDGRIAWLGEFSEEKYAFLVTVLHIRYEYYVDWGMHNIKLRDELAKYNAENPNNQKNFTFPVNTNSIWGY